MRVAPLTISALIWLAFIIYWNNAARGAAPTVSQESVQSRQLHVLLMYGALACTLFLRVWPLDQRWVPESRALIATGFVVQLAGFALAAWARVHLGRNWSGAITAKAGHVLVRTGPYRMIRHPIYSAMLLMFIGPALIGGAWHGVLGFAIIAYAYWRKIRLEEASLRATFGDSYDDYARHSSAIVPGVL